MFYLLSVLSIQFYYILHFLKLLIITIIYSISFLNSKTKSLELFLNLYDDIDTRN